MVFKKTDKDIRLCWKVPESCIFGFIRCFASPCFLNPLGSVNQAPIQPNYQEHAFFTGFTQGYNTLDALAALAFGIIIVTTIQNMGVTKPAEIAKDTIKSGAISIILMGIIYTLLAYLGAMSLGSFALSENGGITLAQIADHYLGTYGSILLAFIVILACLKTGIGLITALQKHSQICFRKEITHSLLHLLVSFLV